jgi:hypothetical protein
MSVRWTRWAPLAGPVFAIVLLVAVLWPSGPNSNASGASVATYYADHDTSQNIMAYLFAAAAVLVVVFGAVLYSRLLPGSKSRGLITVGFGGAVMIAVGAALVAGTTISLTDSPTAISPAANQALNVANSDVPFIPILVGLVLFMVGYGIAIVCGNVLPRWLGWVAIVLGLASLAGAIGPVGFFTGLLAILWVAVVGVWLFIREWRSSASPKPATSAP